MYKVALITASIEGDIGLSICALKTYADIHIKVPANIQIFYDLQDLLDFSPDMVGISANTPRFTKAKELAEQIKKHANTLVVIGGYHISFLPEEIKHECFDIGVIGEGEQTFTQLIEAVVGKHPLSDVNGLVYKEGADIHVTSRRELLTVDEIPMLTESRRYEGKTAGLFTSRGCPYNCKYCSQIQFWGKGVRTYSPESVVNEIKWLHQQRGVEHIHIYDDLFIYPTERLHKIVNLLQQEDLLTKLTFDGSVRANWVNDEVVDLLKRMSFNFVYIGLESGSDRILKMYKPGVSVAINQNAIDISIKHGIKVAPNMMVGFPGETKKDLLETAAFIRHNIDMHQDKMHWQLFLVQIYPGTELWNNLSDDAKQSIVNAGEWHKTDCLFSQLGFDWDGFKYFNENTIPRNEFIDILKNNFPNRILVPLQPQPLLHDVYRIKKWQMDNFKYVDWYVRKIDQVLDEGYRLLLYGAGNMGKFVIENLRYWTKYKPGCNSLRIGGIIDENHEHLPKFIDGDIPVLPPSAALRNTNEKILILSVDHFWDIRVSVLDMGVSPDRIISIPDSFPEFD